MEYITFDFYKTNGGKCSESAFSILRRKAENKLNYFTFGRIEKLDSIPEDIQLVEVDLIDYLYNAESSSGTQPKNLSSYSNGIESFSFLSGKDAEVNTNIGIYNLIKDGLFRYPQLLHRGI